MRNGLFFCWLILQICMPTFLFAQSKRPLEHEDYDIWNRITGSQLSEDGQWLMYTIRDGKEKATLKIRDLDSSKEYSITNAAGPRFAFDGKHVAYRVVPDKDLVRKLKKDEKNKDQLPQEKFEVLNLNNGGTITLQNVQSFAFPAKNGEWIAIKLKAIEKKTSAETSKSKLSESYEVTEEGLMWPGTNKEQKKEGSGKKPLTKEEAKPSEEMTSEKKGQEDKKKDKPNGTVLVLKNLNDGLELRLPFVTSYRFNESGSGLLFATSNKDNASQDGVWHFDLGSRERKQIVSGLGNYKNLTFDKKGTQVAFLTDRDDYQTKESSWSLYHWRKGQSEARKIVAETNESIPDGWWLSSTSSPFFADTGRMLFYHTAPKPEELNSNDDEDKEPQAKLDLWHWQDPLLQPQQLLQAQAERNRSYLAAFNLRTRKAVQLATKDVPDVSVDTKRDSEIAVGISDKKYRKMISWDIQGYRDVYVVNLRTGKRELVLERLRSRPQLSPNAKYLMWWDTESKNWFAKSTRTGSETKNLTEKIKVPLYNELHDTPSDPRAHGVVGWTEKDRHVLIYDRYDIWQLDPDGQTDPVCLTESFGRENRIRLRNQRLDREARHIDAANLFLTAFNEDNKDSGYYRMRVATDTQVDSESKKKPVLEKVIMLPEQLAGFSKAQQSERVVFTRSTYRRFPDLWASDMSFKKIQRISDANPQQQDYAWGTVELTEWKATDGQTLSGLLYKPEAFDTAKKYPLMVYFYERNSDNLHRHYVPAAGRSIINFSFYVSRGYVVFVPDIPYKTGEPGPSAANAVLPGVRHVIDQGFIDEKRIGMQGHSWGGYQTAYLVTQTDMFACAESGAPVSNMTSAYGGIRWSTGLSRMFQYEKTQSRIGDTLWNAQEKYIANSPLFFVDKINTPLLILHNDQDGAVPWYQGIEMFVAMRRLEKPAWLLNYNGDPHWVMGRENRLDFAKRMQQFFDHYLKDKPMPKWMADGIPAVDKGKAFGFEPVEAEESGSGRAEETAATN